MPATPAPPSHVFVTKYALTQGIQRCALLEHHEWGVTVSWPGSFDGKAYFSKKDFALALADAEVQADALRLHKIKLIQKQIKHLETLKIKVVER